MSIGFTLLNGEGKGTFFEMPEEGSYVIGRDIACSICVKDKVASKNHAMVHSQNGTVTVEDMMSQNGTYVNGRRVDRTVIRDGDTLTVGMTVLKLCRDETGSSVASSIFADRQAINVPVPIHEPFFMSNSDKLMECTRQIQALLNENVDNIVKKSMKVLFNILPVSRLSLFNVQENEKLSQGYTVMRKSNQRVSSMSQSVAQKVLLARKEIMIEDTSELDSADASASIGFLQVQAIMGVPVTVQGRIRAVLLGDNIEQPGVFNDEHLRIMRFASKVIEVLYQLDAVYKLDNVGNFLPICACCKKIRDDQGYWNQLESYISERSAAKFSHGYCPECEAKAIAEIEQANRK